MTGSAETPILLNGSICTTQTPNQWNKAGGAPYLNGVYYKMKDSLSKLLNNKASNFIEDSCVKHAPKSAEKSV